MRSAMDRITRLSETIRTLMDGEFSGYIKINFSQGSLGRVEKSEEFEDAAIALTGRNNGKKRSAAGAISRETLKAVPVVLLMSALCGCVAPGTIRPAQSAGDARTVRPGDAADIRYLCRMGSGEIAAATDNAPEGPKANIFVLRKDTGPMEITAAPPDEQFTPKQEDPFEVEILNRLSNKVAGMKVGEKRSVQMTAQNVPARDEQNYIVRLTRVRTRPKEMKFTLAEYRDRAHREPEVGQPFAIDPSFPGKVEAVTEQDVTVRFFAKPGELVQTPFGPGLVSEEGPNYRVEIDARKGGLTRVGGMIGRIVDVDEQNITVDYRNPFGHETLLCDVTVEKIRDAKIVTSGE
jgi:FKBP-type peptidyl-prolyl cis-trans isomerase 2